MTHRGPACANDRTPVDPVKGAPLSSGDSAVIQTIHDPLRRVVRKFLVSALVATAGSSVLLLAACSGGNSGSGVTPATSANAQVQGTSVGQYANAMVCADINQNGVCDAGEPSTTTDATGAYTLAVPAGTPMVEMIAASTAFVDPVKGAGKTTSAVVYRSLADMNGLFSPLTTDVARLVDTGQSESAATAQIAQRLGVSAAQVTSDYTKITDVTAKTALETEANLLNTRFALASTMVSRGDVSPVTNVPETLKQAEQDAFNLEGVPRYDNVFVIILENETNTKIDGGASTPNITAALQSGAKASNYYSVGSPSEPNYVALGSGDTWGVTSDDPWFCIPAGDTTDLPTDSPPVGETVANQCDPGNAPSVHNIKNGRNIFLALENAGLSWHVYSESMNPGMDPRGNSTPDQTILAPDHNNPSLLLFYPGAYAPRHNPTLDFDDVRNDPSFTSNQRTMGGGQWDQAFLASPETPAGYDIDQLGTDLASGNVANVNYLVPDLCDDMHNQTVTDVTGTIPATDCSAGPAILKRGDNYTQYLISKIKASPLWNNPARRVAIVITFDEGSGNYLGPASCCGWNAVGNTQGEPQGEDGKMTVTTPILNYNNGNEGNGPVVFGVLTNQASAPTGVNDQDEYSHIAFVRTLQDMFALADPGVPDSYMNRSKYTQSYIAANLQVLPEYAGSVDSHWDAVRPMAKVFALK
jgi:Phosphoesterase family